MRTYLDCIPCFFKQAQDAARLAGADLITQKKILGELSEEILKFNLACCPSEMGRILYRMVRKTTGEDDPFREIKRKSNKFALALYPQLKKKIEDAKDRLLMAIELAIAGNVIDYGVQDRFNITHELKKIFAQGQRKIRRENRALFDYPGFKKGLNKAKRILYLADNAAEVVFDRVLIEELKDKDITYAVRKAPIINDALIEDALFCGIDKCARIISSGSDAPGTILRLCTRRFRKIYQQAEFIISKGQGNFEALTEQRRPIFFLFRAKCSVVAKHLRCKVGSVILTRTK